MTTTIPSSALVPVVQVFTSTERLALTGFLAGYSGLTRQACERDLRSSPLLLSPGKARPGGDTHLAALGEAEHAWRAVPGCGLSPEPGFAQSAAGLFPWGRRYLTRWAERRTTGQL